MADWLRRLMHPFRSPAPPDVTPESEKRDIVNRIEQLESEFTEDERRRLARMRIQVESQTYRR